MVDVFHSLFLFLCALALVNLEIYHIALEVCSSSVLVLFQCVVVLSIGLFCYLVFGLFRLQVNVLWV